MVVTFRDIFKFSSVNTAIISKINTLVGNNKTVTLHPKLALPRQINIRYRVAAQLQGIRGDQISHHMISVTQLSTN